MRNLYKIGLFIVLLVSVDLVIGVYWENLYNKSKYGIFGRQVYACNNLNDNILILGSSRAAHHYVPSLFEEELGQTCYNAGSDGMSVYYHYPLLSCILENHKPKIVIFDISQTDIEYIPSGGFSLTAAVDRLNLEYQREPVKRLISHLSTQEQFCLYSDLYRYNSKFIQLFNSNYIEGSKLYKGYEPLYDEMKTTARIIKDNKKTFKIDSFKIKYLDELIVQCKSEDIALYLVNSPSLVKNTSKFNLIVDSISVANNIPLLLYNDSLNYKFKDEVHLNDDGAHSFSRDLIQQIKTLGVK